MYVWCRTDGDRRAIWIDTTGLDPPTRVLGETALDVLALQLPPDVPRSAVKLAALASFRQRGLLSADYVGDRPVAPTKLASPEVIVFAESLADRVAERIAATASFKEEGRELRHSRPLSCPVGKLDHARGDGRQKDQSQLVARGHDQAHEAEPAAG